MGLDATPSRGQDIAAEPVVVGCWPGWGRTPISCTAASVPAVLLRANRGGQGVGESCLAALGAAQGVRAPAPPSGTMVSRCPCINQGRQGEVLREELARFAQTPVRREQHRQQDHLPRLQRATSASTSAPSRWASTTPSVSCRRRPSGARLPAPVAVQGRDRVGRPGHGRQITLLMAGRAGVTASLRLGEARRD